MAAESQSFSGAFSGTWSDDERWFVGVTFAEQFGADFVPQLLLYDLRASTAYELDLPLATDDNVIAINLR